MATFKIIADHMDGRRAVFTYDNQRNRFEHEDGTAIGQADESRAYVAATPFGRIVPLHKSPNVRVLKIQLGLSCNYACSYCSQRFVVRADETTARDVARFMAGLDALQFSEGAGLSIEFWGGEPLVYWKTLVPLVAALRARFDGWQAKPRMLAVTNGSLFNAEICDWLYDNGFQVGLSHDGPGQHMRGPDPFDNGELRSLILRFWKRMHAEGRMSFNAMLNRSNTSRRDIYQWFVNLTGDESVRLGEGTLIDAYDDDGVAASLKSDAEHWLFRQTAFTDIWDTNGEIGFDGIIGKINAFMDSARKQVPAFTLGQKCGMDRHDTLAIDLRGNVLTCQNTSAVERAPNGQPHRAGHISNMRSVAVRSSTHWSEREHCSKCPVIHLCQGSCMFLEGDRWDVSCANAYSDNIALFALAFARLTGGFIPVIIEPIDADDFPANRRDIWGGGAGHAV